MHPVAAKRFCSNSGTRVFLVRHAESISNIDLSIYDRLGDHAIPLSDRGINQCKALQSSLEEILPSNPIQMW